MLFQTGKKEAILQNCKKTTLPLINRLAFNRQIVALHTMNLSSKVLKFTLVMETKKLKVVYVKV